MKYYFFLIGLLAISFEPAAAQCCSGGNSFGGNSNVGIVEKSNLRFSTFFRHSYSEDYYAGENLVHAGSLKQANFNYAGLNLAYGVSRRLTVEVETGYFPSKTQVYKLFPNNPISGSGFSNSIFSVKYNFFNFPALQLEYTAGIGYKMAAFTDPVYTGGYSIDIQPSTGANGWVLQSFLSKKIPDINAKLILLNRYEYNEIDPIKNYRFGSTLFSSLFFSEKLADNFSGILQIRHEYRTRDTKADQSRDANTGGHILLVSPQFSYVVFKGWNAALAIDIPVYRNYNGKQFANLYAVSLSVSKIFNLRKKHCDI